MRAAASLSTPVLTLAGAIAVIVVMVLAPRLLFEKTLKIAIHQGVEGVALKEIIGKFADSRGVSVEVIEMPYDKLYESELKDVSGAYDRRYDVIMLDDPWMPAMATGLHKLSFDKCELLEDFVESTLKVGRNPYSDKPVSCGEKFHAIPFVGNSQLFIRKADSRTPAQWDDVVNSNYVMRVGGGNQIVTDFMPMLWASSRDSFVISDNSDNGVSLSDAKPAFELLRKLGQRGTANLSIVSQDDFDLAIHLVRNKANTSIIWTAWAMAMRKLPSPYRYQLRQDFVFEDVPGGHPALGAWLLAIPMRAPHEIRARDFISFATGKRQIMEAALAGNPPPLKSVLQLHIDDVLDNKSEADRELKQELTERFEGLAPAQYASLEKARPRPRTPHWKQIESALGLCLSGVYESSIPVDDALSRASVAIAAIESGHPPEGFTCN